MKKWLLIFLIIDFVFIGLMLTFVHRKSRQVASENQNGTLGDLSEGQRNKWQLVETFQFTFDADTISLKTDKLQMICESSDSVQLRFLAQNVAVAGQSPMVSHTFFCAEIKKDLAQNTLTTNVADFIQLKTEKKKTLQGSQLNTRHIYSDEEFPSQWRLAEVVVTGPNTFTVNEHEIAKTLLKNFDFEITSVK